MLGTSEVIHQRTWEESFKSKKREWTSKGMTGKDKKDTIREA